MEIDHVLVFLHIGGDNSDAGRSFDSPLVCFGQFNRIVINIRLKFHCRHGSIPLPWQRDRVTPFFVRRLIPFAQGSGQRTQRAAGLPDRVDRITRSGLEHLSRWQ